MLLTNSISLSLSLYPATYSRKQIAAAYESLFGSGKRLKNQVMIRTHTRSHSLLVKALSLSLAHSLPIYLSHPISLSLILSLSPYLSLSLSPGVQIREQAVHDERCLRETVSHSYHQCFPCYLPEDEAPEPLQTVREREREREIV